VGAGHVLHRDRVVAAHGRALVPQHLGDGQGGRLAHVVGAGLEGQPQQADRLAPQIAAKQLVHLEHRRLALEVIDLDHGFQELRVLAAHLSHVLERLDILGEAGAAVAHPGVQETGADALVEAHAARHFDHVRPQTLADVGDLVDEADLGRQEGVGGVLDHLRRAQVGDHDRGAQRQVKLGHRVRRHAILRAKHGAVRTHEVVDGRAFPQEFRAAHHGELDRARLGLADDVGHPVAGADRHGALVDDDQRMIHDAGNRLGGHAHVLQVGLAVDAFRRPHTDKDEFCVLERLLITGGKGQTPGADVALHHLLEARLVDRHDALLEAGDLLLVDVQGDHPVA